MNNGNGYKPLGAEEQLKIIKQEKPKIGYTSVRTREDLVEAVKQIAQNEGIKHYSKIVDTVLRSWVHENFPHVAHELEVKTPLEILHYD